MNGMIKLKPILTNNKMKYILVFLLAIFSLGCNNKVEDVIFIIPKDYTGYVIILFEQENGREKEYEDQKRLYKVSENGILKTKFEAEYGVGNFPTFFYENIEGQQIPYKAEFERVELDNVNAFGGSVGKANKNLEGTSFVRFALYYIGNKEQIQKAIKESERIDYIELIGNE